MSILLSLLSDIFHSEMFILRGLLHKGADQPRALTRNKPTSGIVRQLFGFVASWAGLRYLYVEVDWRTVGEFCDSDQGILEGEVSLYH
jgi:hypothetical protein